MRSYMIRIVLVAAMLASSGCMGPKPYTVGKRFQPIQAPPAGTAQVVLYMDLLTGAYFGNGHEPLESYLYENDDVVGMVVPNTYATYHITPGTHEYWMGKPSLLGSASSSWGPTWLTLHLKENQTYYLRYHESIFPLWNWGTLEVVEEPVALEELESMRHVQFHKHIYAQGRFTVQGD